MIPDYNLCTKHQKEVAFNICSKMHKNTVMICGIDGNNCSAWKGYVHDPKTDLDYSKDTKSMDWHRHYNKKMGK
jgi:hypothetical protein